jgi:hypothetical protein
MAFAASLDRSASKPGESSPEATITLIVILVSKLVISTTVFRGKDLVAA